MHPELQTNIMRTMDVMTKAQRTYCMSRIGGKNTKPEITIRKILWATGIRGYRLHAKLPGRPDIYFPSAKAAVFIDGCFWHGCKKCNLVPVTNRKFWTDKFLINKSRDKRNNRDLRKRVIRVLRIWEHQVKQDPVKTAMLLIKDLIPDASLLPRK